MALISMLNIISGDNWNNIWIDCTRGVGSIKANLYFFIFIVISKVIFINSFTAIILISFDFVAE